MPLRFARLCASVGILSLASCSALLEHLRPTYDESVVQVGVPRDAIERQLGKPQSISALSGNEVEAIYRTSRVSEAAKENVTDGRVEGDILTLGLAEVISPPFMFETEAMLFKIDYDSGGHAVRILRRCAIARSDQQWWDETASSRACAHGAAPL